VCTKRPTCTKRELQQRPTCATRDLNVRKETILYEKRPECTKRDLNVRKKTSMHEKRATKGKQMGKKRPTKETCKREVPSACRYLTYGNCVVCQKRPIYAKRGIQKRRVREKSLLHVATSHGNCVVCQKRPIYAKRGIQKRRVK